MPNPPWKLITFDVDGTLTTVHGWGFLAERVGRVAEFEESNRRFRLHEIGEDEHLTDLLHLADGRTLKEVERILEATPKFAGVTEMLATWHAEGTRVALLSHNPDYVCAWTSGASDSTGSPGPPFRPRLTAACRSTGPCTPTSARG